MNSPLEPTLRTPWTFQTECVEWALDVGAGKVLIADDMGLGKTGEIYMIWKKLGFPKPCIILASVNAQMTWMVQAPQWGCPTPVRVYGKATERRALWNKHKFGFVVTTREALRRDVASGVVNLGDFRCVISDEAHKDSNRKTKNWQQLKDLSRSARYLLFSTGSALRKGPQGVWGLLNILRPTKYGSYWNFLDKYCYITRGPFGWEILGTKDEEQFKSEMSSVMIARTKKDVRPSMPPKVRDLDSNILQMTGQQLDMYNKMTEEAIIELTNGDLSIGQSILTKILRLRQILVTPKILDPQAEDGAGINRLVEMLDDANDQHMVIFSPFTTALPHIRSRLVKEGFEDRSIIELSGGLSLEELMRRVETFRQTKGIAICGIRYAESFDLIPATWAVFLGYEWDAWDNLQAEDRLHRGEIVNPVNYYYFSHDGGVDREMMLPALDTKTNNAMAYLKDIDKIRKTLTAARKIGHAT